MRYLDDRWRPLSRAATEFDQSAKYVRLPPSTPIPGSDLRLRLVERPSADVQGCRQANARLSAAIDDLTDSIARNPSLLSGWTVGHVMTHLARNAESMVRRIEAASRDERIDQYVGGTAGRASEIEAGAGRSAVDLVADVRAWSGRLDDTFASLPDDWWGRPVCSVGGGQHAVA